MRRFGEVWRGEDGDLVMVVAKDPAKQYTTVVSLDGMFVGGVMDRDAPRWDLVDGEPPAMSGYYLFVGGPADGKTYLTGGLPRYIVPVPRSISATFDEEAPVASLPSFETVDYELRRDGRYHLVGGS